jgi:diamine N-acetyltransferase
MLRNINIRKADLGDASNLAVLKQQVWIATYAVEGIRTEFSEYVLSAFTIENIRNSILENNKFIYIAVIDNHLIGCLEIAFNKKCPIETETGPEIAVLYLLERYTGMGIGKTLLNRALSLCEELKFTSVWLTVYHKNERAINFYLKQNFTDSGNTFFEMGGNRYENKIMIRQIKQE